ncbi:uncharacterized protein PSFLO_04387 [Pseudozyma flocculosa]|uniref:Uncharacterized protein n=1 Tax=Pseudozyma flocculosa TaxID=84751 RepID=A0A5C3F395_9BASI|nr:uncharacterized protein PSFLO_04387 [Pseudozyma flocculosa]
MSAMHPFLALFFVVARPLSFRTTTISAPLAPSLSDLLAPLLALPLHLPLSLPLPLPPPLPPRLTAPAHPRTRAPAHPRIRNIRTRILVAGHHARSAPLSHLKVRRSTHDAPRSSSSSTALHSLPRFGPFVSLPAPMRSPSRTTPQVAAPHRSLRLKLVPLRLRMQSHGKQAYVASSLAPTCQNSFSPVPTLPPSQQQAAPRSSADPLFYLAHLHMLLHAVNHPSHLPPSSFLSSWPQYPPLSFLSHHNHDPAASILAHPTHRQLDVALLPMQPSTPLDCSIRIIPAP